MDKFDKAELDRLENDLRQCAYGEGCGNCTRFHDADLDGYECNDLDKDALEAIRYLRLELSSNEKVCEKVDIHTEKCDSEDKLSKNAQNYTKEKSCLDCAFCDVSELIYPCSACKRAVSRLDPAYKIRGDMYAPKVIPTPPETMNLKPSMVEHPAHYNREGAMECIDEMVLLFGIEEAIVFCKLSAWKYRYRAGEKDDAKQDMKKSDNFLKMYKELKERLDNDQY